MQLSSIQSWRGLSYDISKSETTKVRSFFGRNSCGVTRLNNSYKVYHLNPAERINNSKREDYELGSIEVYDPAVQTSKRYSRLSVITSHNSVKELSILEKFVSKNFKGKLN